MSFLFNPKKCFLLRSHIHCLLGVRVIDLPERPVGGVLLGHNRVLMLKELSHEAIANAIPPG